MSRCEFTPQARADLRGIHDYIAEDNPTAALRFIDLLERACYRLADSPMMGRIREELSPNLRSHVVGRYLIIYRPIQDGVQIIHVVQGSINLRDLFEDGQ